MSESSAQKSTDSSVQTFTLRAPGALHKGVNYFLGKFPEGFSEFKKKKAEWTLQRQPEDKNARRRGPELKEPRKMPWVLEDSPGHATHIGLPEGGISGSGAGMGYFVLVKEGPDFVALPVKDWYNFKPATRGNAMSLEEAEKQMASRGTVSRLPAGSKLGALAAKAEVEGEAPEEGDQEGEAPDSDEERETQRVARMKAAKVAQEDNMPGTDVATPEGAVGQPSKMKKGDDWEHEDERADDDLEQGDGGEEDDLLNTGVKRENSVDSDEGDGNGRKLTEAGRRMAGVLRKVKLDSDGSDSGGLEDEDSDLDLDEMASKVKIEPKGAPSSRSATPQPGKQPSGKPSAKRKDATPPSRDPAKKVRTDVKQEAAAAGPSSAAATMSPATGPPTQDEILAFLRSSRNLTSQALTKHFRGRLTNDADKKAFSAKLKVMVTLVEGPPELGGKKVLALKAAYR